jgi:hypothetical protein
MEKGASQVSIFHFACFQTKQGRVCHIVALPFTLKSYLMAKKKWHYRYLNISPCKNIIFKKSSKRDPKSFKMLYKSITNLKFQHNPKISSFKNPCTYNKNRPRPKSIKLLYSLMNLNTKYPFLGRQGQHKRLIILLHATHMVIKQSI